MYTLNGYLIINSKPCLSTNEILFRTSWKEITNPFLNLNYNSIAILANCKSIEFPFYSFNCYSVQNMITK